MNTGALKAVVVVRADERDDLKLGVIQATEGMDELDVLDDASNRAAFSFSIMDARPDFPKYRIGLARFALSRMETDQIDGEELYQLLELAPNAEAVLWVTEPMDINKEVPYSLIIRGNLFYWQSANGDIVGEARRSISVDPRDEVQYLLENL